MKTKLANRDSMGRRGDSLLIGGECQNGTATNPLNKKEGGGGSRSSNAPGTLNEGIRKVSPVSSPGRTAGRSDTIEGEAIGKIGARNRFD